MTFGYDPDGAGLRDVTFAIKPGQMVGIVGPTGSGKSTVSSLIPRFRDLDAGSIRIDGVDIRDYKLRELRSQIGFVLQDTVLLRGTVRDNIAFGRPDATDDEISRPPRWPMPTSSSSACPRATTARRRSRYDPLRRPAPTHRHRPRRDSRTVRSSSSTRPPPRSTPSPNAWSSRPSNG